MIEFVVKYSREFSCLGGVVLYVFGLWFVWSNNRDAKVTRITFSKRLKKERQELAATFIGALIFMVWGEGVIDTMCDLVNTLFGSKWEGFCISVQVNNENLSYLLGSATFGTLGIFAAKFGKKQAKKKLDES